VILNNTISLACTVLQNSEKVNIEKASCRWYTPVIPATQKGETEEAWLKISTGKR
jgi:hypothetical protein